MIKASISHLARQVDTLKHRKLALTKELNEKIAEAKVANTRVQIAEKRFAENETELADLEHGLTLLKNSEGIVDYSKGEPANDFA